MAVNLFEKYTAPWPPIHQAIFKACLRKLEFANQNFLIWYGKQNGQKPHQAEIEINQVCLLLDLANVIFAYLKPSDKCVWTMTAYDIASPEFKLSCEVVRGSERSVFRLRFVPRTSDHRGPYFDYGIDPDGLPPMDEHSSIHPLRLSVASKAIRQIHFVKEKVYMAQMQLNTAYEEWLLECSREVVASVSLEDCKTKKQYNAKLEKDMAEKDKLWKLCSAEEHTAEQKLKWCKEQLAQLEEQLQNILADKEKYQY